MLLFQPRIPAAGILPLHENLAHNVYVQEFVERMTVALEENNDMHESIDIDDSDDLIEISLDEHDAYYSCGHEANIYEGNMP